MKVQDQVFFHEEACPWQTNPSYPDDLRARYRYRLLVSQPGLRLGTLELDPGATYPAHAHPAAEIYYLIAGQARWTIDAETQTIRPGAVMRHDSGAVHSFTNIGTTPLRLLWVWWTPDGKREALEIAAQLVDSSQ